MHFSVMQRAGAIRDRRAARQRKNPLKPSHHRTGFPVGTIVRTKRRLTLPRRRKLDPSHMRETYRVRFLCLLSLALASFLLAHVVPSSATMSDFLAPCTPFSNIPC